MKTESFTTYTDFASYFINGDSSGLTGDGLREADNILHDIAKYYVNPRIVSCSEKAQFLRQPDYGTLGGNCYEYYLLTYRTLRF